ncbi:MAG: hypothetical protein M9938_03830 [Solirubrobacterales bacterium]|nr:hypothetical protein [Solirubrobacterales bacterium]
MPIEPTSTPLAVGAGEFILVLLLLVAIVVPVAALAFARSGRGLDDLGRGRFAVDFERDSSGEAEDAWREQELRQLIEARAWRRERRGEQPGDTESEIEHLLDPDAGPYPEDHGSGPPPIANDPGDGLREEVRQVVLAKNESRLRRGEPPLEVEAEVDRLLADLG